MSMSLGGPEFREAVPISEARHPAAPIEPDERGPTDVDRRRSRRCPRHRTTTRCGPGGV